MSALTYLSCMLAALDLAVQYAVAHKIRGRWLLGTLAQFPWIAYDIWTLQLGFLAMPVTYWYIYWSARRKELKEHERVDIAGLPAEDSGGDSGSQVQERIAELVGKKE